MASHSSRTGRFRLMALPSTSPQDSPKLTTVTSSTGRHHRPSADNVAARLLGIAVFLGGVALLVYVFKSADLLFHQAPPTVPPAAALQASAGSSAAAPSAALQIGQSLTDYLKKLLTLLLMCVAGSLIASKGIQLFFSAGRAHAAATAPVIDPGA